MEILLNIFDFFSLQNKSLGEKYNKILVELQKLKDGLLVFWLESSRPDKELIEAKIKMQVCVYNVNWFLLSDKFVKLSCLNKLKEETFEFLDKINDECSKAIIPENYKYLISQISSCETSINNDAYINLEKTNYKTSNLKIFSLISALSALVCSVFFIWYSGVVSFREQILAPGDDYEIDNGTFVFSEEAKKNFGKSILDFYYFGKINPTQATAFFFQERIKQLQEKKENLQKKQNVPVKIQAAGMIAGNFGNFPPEENYFTLNEECGPILFSSKISIDLMNKSFVSSGYIDYVELIVQRIEKRKFPFTCVFPDEKFQVNFKEYKDKNITGSPKFSNKEIFLGVVETSTKYPIKIIALMEGQKKIN